MAIALPLLLLGGAVLLLGGKKKKSSKACPSLIFMSPDSIAWVTVEVPTVNSGTLEIGLPEVAYNEAKRGNRNIVAMTKNTIAHVIPGSCVGDASILVNAKTVSGETVKYSAPELFYAVGYSIAEDLMQALVIDEAEALQLVENLNKWWFDHMGNAPVPQT